MQETQETSVWSLGQEDPLEEDMATHSSILSWRIPWTEEIGRLQSMGLPMSIGSQRTGHSWSNLAHTHSLSLEFTSIQSTVPVVLGHRMESWLLGFIPRVKLVIVSRVDTPKDVCLEQLSVMESGVGAEGMEPSKIYCCTCALNPWSSNCLSAWQG